MVIIICFLVVPTCSVWFSGLDVKVARFPQDVPDILLKEREQSANIFPTQAHQERQILTNHEGKHHFESPSCHTHVEVETFYTPGKYFLIVSFI